MMFEKGSLWSVKRMTRPAAAGCQLWWPASASRSRCLASRRRERRRSSALMPPAPLLPSSEPCRESLSFSTIPRKNL